jgi:NTE family protein
MTKRAQSTGFVGLSLAALALLLSWPAIAGAQDRPKVGVAFGGGSARGLAHVGVIRWLEEHHIPIDVAAGTSIGGLIGGSFATGMQAAELEAMLNSLDWDSLFGSFNYQFKNIRRKSDARVFPPRLEFGLKRGLRPPTALNNGQQVDRLIDRVAAPYYAAPHFDTLPTPFRIVAVDLRTARQVVLDRGSLARAIRATVSFPGLFPPVELDGQVLIDGGAMNNLPADVVRAMGASVVIAVNVNDLTDHASVDYSMFGIMAETLDAMMRANTKATLASAADVVLNVPVVGYAALDWRKSAAIVLAGYEAAEVMRDQLLPHAVGAVEWEKWLAQRKARRKTGLPRPTFLTLTGIAGADGDRLRRLMAKHIGRDLDVLELERDLDQLVGLERYESVFWEMTTGEAGEAGLAIRARPRPYAPPFLMLGFRLENTTSDEFQVNASVRYLQFDVAGSGSELRVDATAGSDPGFSVNLHRPVAGPLFVAPHAGIADRSINVIDHDEVVARYGQRVVSAGLDAGVSLGRVSDARLGIGVAKIDSDVVIGDPALPDVSERHTFAHGDWRFDSQDSPVVAASGIRALASARHTFSTGLTQFRSEASVFRPLGDRHRLFALGGFGTSLDRRPPRFDQFALGAPLHLGAFGVGELMGSHYLLATAGYLREIGHLPGFLGGRVFAGGWLEQGSAFDDWGRVPWHTHVSTGFIVDTVVGPAMLGASVGSGGRWRTYFAIGPVF